MFHGYVQSEAYPSGLYIFVNNVGYYINVAFMVMIIHSFHYSVNHFENNLVTYNLAVMLCSVKNEFCQHFKFHFATIL